MHIVRTLTMITAIGLMSAMASPAIADTKPPDRCIHAVGAATRIMGDLVTDQLLHLDATSQISAAHDAAALVSHLRCSTDLFVKSVDCIVAFVRSTSKRPEPTDVAHCVETAAGQKLFK